MPQSIKAALERIDWHQQNIRLRKILTSSLVAPLIVIIGPAVDLIMAPAADAAVTTETAINVGRNTTTNDPFTMSFGTGSFAIYIKLVNPAAGQYLTMGTTFTNTNDYFGGSSSNFTEAVFIGTQSEFNSTFNAGSGKLRLVTGANANSNTSIMWSADPWSSVYRYSTTNHHFYKFVTESGKSWTSSSTSANGTTFIGTKGYLATISNATENAEVTAAGVDNSFTSGAYWIGAGDNALEGVWRWTASNTNAPETGKIFYTQYCVNNSASAPTSTPTSTSCSESAAWSSASYPQGSLYTQDGFNYANWNGSTWTNGTFTPGYQTEPNNADGTSGEDFSTIIMDSGGNRGKWNDLRDGNTPTGYVMEFGEASGNLQPSTYSQKAITSFSISTGYSALTTTFGTAASSTTPATTGGRANISYSIANSSNPAVTINSSTGVVSLSSSATTADNGTYTVTATENSGTAGNSFTATTTISVTVSKLTLTTPGSLTLTATSGTAKSIGVSWTDVSNESGYTITLLEGSTLRATIILSANVTSKTLTTSDYSGFSDGTSYTINLVAVGNATQYETSTAASSSVTTNQTARTATFGTATRQSLGFTVPISNYDNTFTYETATSSAGSASLVGSNIVVTGLTKGAGATVSISTRKSGFVSTTTSSGLYYALETATAMSITDKTMTVGAPYKILYSADASNPNKPTYTSGTTSVCTVSGETITPLTAGSCSITGTLAGYSTYDTTTATRTFTVNAAPSLSTSTISNRTYGSTATTYQVVTSNGVAPYSYTILRKTTGAVISGLTIDSSGLITFGQYLAAGIDTATVTVTDANGVQSTRDYSFTVLKKAATFTLTANGDTTTTLSKPLSFNITTSDYALTGTVSLSISGTYDLPGCQNIDISSGTATCNWITDRFTSLDYIYLSYSGDTNYKSKGQTPATETGYGGGLLITVNQAPYIVYWQQTFTYGTTNSFKPNQSLYGTGPRSAWTWDIVRASDSQTVSGISNNGETITVSSSLPIGTYNMVVRATDAKLVTSNSAVTITISKGDPLISLSIESASVTVGKSTRITVTAAAPGVTGTVALYQGNTTNVIAGCESITLTNSTGSCLATSSSAYGPTAVYYQYLGDSNYNSSSKLTSSQNIQFYPRTVMSYGTLTTTYGTPGNLAGTYSARGGGASNLWTWSIVKRSDSSTVSGIAMSGETITVSNTVPAGTYLMTVVSTDGLGDTVYTNVTVTVNPLTGLTPTFGAVTRTANGFTTFVSNYDANYGFSATVSAGTVESGTASGLNLPLTVTGLGDSASATITVTTSRLNYSSPTGTVTGTSLGVGLTPSFGSVTKTATGFTVTISNYSASYTWTESVTAGSVTAGSPSGSNRTYTVTGLSPGQSATLYVTDTSTATKSATGFITGAAKASQASITVTKTSGTYPSETLTATGGSGTGSLSYSLSSETSGVFSVGTTDLVASTGTYIYGAQVSPDASTVYLSDYSNHALLKYNVSTRATQTFVIPGVTNGRQLAITPDGNYVFMATGASIFGKLNSQLQTLETFTVTGITSNWGIAISPDGTKLYVADANNAAVKELSTSTLQILRSWSMTSGDRVARTLAVDSSGRYLFIANGKGTLGSAITRIDLNAANSTIENLPIGNDVSPNPLTLSLSRDGTRIVTTSGGTTINSIDINAATFASSVVKSISLSGVTTRDIAISSDGTYALATNLGNNSLYSIDLTAATLSSSIVGSLPTGHAGQYMAINPAGDKAYVSSSLSSQEFITPVSIPSVVNSARCSISGNTIYAQSAGTCKVIATKATDADYLPESSTATTFTFTAATALRVSAVPGSVNYGLTSKYTPRASISGFVSTDTGTVTSPSYTYLGINGTNYSSSPNAPIAVGTYSVTPSSGIISLSSGYLAGYATPVSYVADTLTVLATIPDSVTALSATATSPTTATVTFTSPANTGGSAITNYLVTNSTDSVTATANSTSINITGLRPGSAYVFKVNAINSVGRSETATASSITTPLQVTITPSVNTGVFGNPITNIVSTVVGGSSLTYSISPSLPAGLTLNLNGSITGTPTETSTVKTYTETATATGTSGTATFTLSVINATSSISVPTITPVTPVMGSPITFTSTVTSNTQATLTGTISFKNAANVELCATSTLSAGVGSCDYTPITTDTFTVRAFFSGMTYVDTSTSLSALTVVPTKGNPSVTLAASPANVVLGRSTTLTTTIVTGTATNATGQVAYTINTTAISGCSAVNVTSNAATCSFTPTSTGIFTVLATYVGDANYNGVVASTLNITVSSCTQSQTGLTLATGAPAAGYCAVSITAGTTGSLGLPVGVVSMTSRVLVIGGGGSGGSRHGGGGGAGSVLYAASLALSDTSTVTIGSGGTSVTGSRGNNGNSTTFGSAIAAGGGSGGGAWSDTGAAGGSGGGGSATNAGATGAQSAVTGYVSYVGNGATGTAGSSYTGGGGGGAGGNGTAGSAGTSPSTPGSGGAGIEFNMTLTGEYACFAGGGGGGQYSVSGRTTPGTGGGCNTLVTSKVGGNGNVSGSNAEPTITYAESGTANTGSGGGGGGFSNANYASGAGGSGLVALRYISPVTITVPSDTTTASLTTLTFVATAPQFGNIFTRTYQWQRWDTSTARWVDDTSTVTSTTLTYTFVATYKLGSSQKIRLLVTDSDGTLQTKSASRTITLTVTPLVQPTLVVASTYGFAGSSFKLYTTGGGGTGAVTFAYVSAGSAAGCSLSAGALTLATPGICKVIATKAADGDYLIKVSETATVSFVSFQMTVQVAPTNTQTGVTTSGSTTTSKGSDACSSGCVPSITSISIYSGQVGVTITLTGVNFTGATKVTFNATTAAASFTVVSDTQITTVVPSGLPLGEVGIDVTTPGGISARNFEFELVS